MINERKEYLTVFFLNAYQVVSKKLPAADLVPLLETLQQGLLDSQTHSSSGACVVLNGIMKLRGGDIRPQVNKY